MNQTPPKMVAEIERPAADWPSRLAGASGLFAIALGATVMLGWHLHNTTVVRLTPALAPMAYNAALTFVLCGAGLLASAFGRRRLAAGLGVATAVVGLLTAVEYLLGLDLHIDQLFMRAYFPQETPTPNRMAPNVATGFILLGSALVLLARPGGRRRPLILGLLGSGVAALGLAPLAGLLIGIQTAFGWGNLTRMALHSAIGLAILGLAIVACAWQEGKEKETGAPRWLPILIGMAGAMVSLALWQALVVQEHTQIDRLVQSEANNLLDDSIAQLDARAKGLDRLGLQWETLGRPKPAEWDWDASLAFDYRILQVTAWVDPSLHARWIVPDRGNEGYREMNLGAIEPVRQALQTAQLRREMRATRWFALPSGDLGFLIARPLFPRGQFDGFVVGIFALNGTFPAVFRPIGEAKYAVLLLEEGEQLLDYRPAGIPYDDEWGAESKADFYGKKLRLRVLPPHGLVSEIASVLPGVFLAGELLMTLLLSLAVYLFQTSQVRGYQLATINRELKDEIAERERAQEEIRKQAELLSLTHDSIILRDLHDRIIFWNRGAEEGYGWTSEEAKGNVIHSFLQTKFPQPFEAFRAQLHNEGRWEGELVHKKRDGAEIVVASRQVVQRDQRGNPIAILEINNDITERKRAEERLRAASEYARSLLEASLDPLVTISPEGKITDVNAASVEVTGVPREKLIGTDFSDYFTQPEKAREGYKQVFEKGAVSDYPLVIRHRSGQLTDVLYNASVYRDSRGKVVGVFAAARDVTARKRAEEELQRHAQELARSNAELEQFAYVASHDLQEPLRMVASYTQLLAKRYRSKLDEDADDFIEYAVDGARRMQNLIGDLLAYSRVGTRGKEFAPADTEQVLEVALFNLSKAIEETGARVMHDPLPTIMADDSQLVQLFQNLIGNAIKFHGADPPCVHISARPQMRDWIFSVRDNGIGIDPEHQQRIFVIFQRLHGKSEYPGTGIGLAICKKIVERHHGHIRVESQPGKGSTFYFTIPA